MHSEGGVTKPDPDPTVLTTAQLVREISTLKESAQASLVGTEKSLTARIEGIEKAIQVAHHDAVRIPTLLQDAIENLRKLVWERFDTADQKIKGMEALSGERLSAIQQRFKERDVRVKQTAKTGGEALRAALQAAKEAVAAQQTSNSEAISKSEQATKEQIAALGTTIAQNTKASDGAINDLKSRLDRLEGQGTGRTDMWGWIVAAITMAAGVLYMLGHLTK
jgi:hypothetical protein